MRESPQTYRRRRATALVVIAGVLVTIGWAVRSCGGGDGDDNAAQAGPKGAVSRATQLPGGGRRIFPHRRVVGFYGAPQSARLGQLGIGTPARAAARLKRVARAYERKTRPVLLAFELISTIATAAPGEDGLHRMHQTPATIDRYLRAARRARALLVLDIQPGRGDFFSEAKRLERWLREPDVGLALDPEWHVADDEIPGTTIGSVSAEEVNAVSSYLSDLVARHDLPEKLFVVHQFTHDMITGKHRVQRPRGLAVTMNVDGFGDPANKVSKYDAITSQTPRFNDGFKLFYDEDTNLMSPGAVLALSPPPDLVVYE